MALAKNFFYFPIRIGKDFFFPIRTEKDFFLFSHSHREIFFFISPFIKRNIFFFIVPFRIGSHFRIGGISPAASHSSRLYP